MGLLDKIKAQKAEQKVEQKEEQAVEPVTINPPDGTPMDKEPDPPEQPSLVIDPPKVPSVTALLVQHHETLLELSDEHFELWQALSTLALWQAEGRSNKRGEKPKKAVLLEDIELIERIASEDIAVSLNPLLEDTESGHPLDQHQVYKEQAEPATADTGKPAKPDAFEEAYDKEQAAREEESDSGYDMPPTLYIGCIPRGGSENRHTIGRQVWLEDFLRPYQDRVAENRSVPHYSLIEYAKGEKEVAALVSHELRNEICSLPSVMIADRRMSGSAAVLEVLVQNYAHVVERLG